MAETLEQQEVAEEKPESEGGAFDAHFENPDNTNEPEGDVDLSVADSDEQESTAEQADEPTPVEAPQPPAAEGPSLAMQAIAKQAGIPEQFIRLSRDDAQLQEIIDLAHQKSVDAEPAPVADWEPPLPEDEYSADDNVRKAFVSLNQHLQSELGSLREIVREATGVIQGVHNRQEQSSQQQAVERQRRFDAKLSSLQSEYLGNGELNDNQVTLRSAIWNKAQEAQQRSPGTPIEELAEQAARELLPMIFNGNAIEAGKRQAKKRLGAGPSKAPEPTKSKQDNLFAKWEQILNR